MPLQICDQNGCIAEYPISDAEIAAMIKGADLTVSMQSLRKQSVPFTLPVFKAPPGLSSGADGPANCHWLCVAPT
jgi:invasion protein IalB